MTGGEREIGVRFTGDASDLRRVGREAEEALRGVGSTGGNMARELVGQLGQIASAAAVATAAFQAFKAGIGANAEIESLKLGISTLVSANTTIIDQQGKQIEGAKKLEVAQAQVGEVFKKLQQDAINTTATLPQLAQAFQSALSSALPLGVSLDDTRKMTVQLVQAMGALNIPLDQANQEINSILQAQISEDSMLGKKLKIKNEEVKLWQEQGTLVENILKKTEAFAVAGQKAGETWAGATSTLSDNLSKIAGIATADSFETLKGKLNDLNANAFGDEAQENARLWGVIINDGIEGALMGAEAVGSVLIEGASKALGIMQGIKSWASQLGAEQYRAEAFNQLLGTFKVGNLVSGAGDNRMGALSKFLMAMAPSDTPSSVLIGMAEAGGLKGKELERFKTSLASIDKNAAAGAAGQANEGDEALKEFRKQNEERRKMLERLRMRSNAAGNSGALSGFDLAEARHSAGLESDTEYRTALVAHIRTLKTNSEDQIKRLGELKKLDEKILDAKRKQAEEADRLASEMGLDAAASPLDRMDLAGGSAGLKGYRDMGGLGVSFLKRIPNSLGSGDLGVLTGMEGYSDGMPEQKEIGSVDSSNATGFGLSSLEDKITAADSAAERARDRMDGLADTLRTFADVASDAITALASGGDVLGNLMDVARGYSGMARAEGFDRFAKTGDATMMTGSIAFDVALGMINYGKNQEMSEAQLRKAAGLNQRGLNRGALENAFYREQSRSYNVFDMGDLWTGITRGGNLVAGEDESMRRARAKAHGEVVAYDERVRERLMGEFNKTPEGARDNALRDLKDWAESMKETLPTETIEEYTTAKTREIEATYNLIKAKENEERLARDAAAGERANEHLKSARDRFLVASGAMTEEQVAVKNAQEALNGGAMSDASGVVQWLTGKNLSTKELMDLAGGDGLKNWLMGVSSTEFGGGFYNGRGIDPGMIAKLDEFDALMLDYKSILAEQSKGNVGRMSDDPQAIKLAAPEVSTMQITMTNQFNVGGNFIGDRASFIAFAREIGIELALQGSQSA